MSDSGTDEAMHAEFGDVAAWTADTALALGPEYLEPAGCRGSGGPGTLDLLLDGLDIEPGDILLDVGAGVGGPSAYAIRTRGVRAVAVEPESPACRAAARLFATGAAPLRVAVGDAMALPFASAAFAKVWSLGVLCTTDDHVAYLCELARVTAPGGRIALLVYVRQGALPEQPDGNNFPTEASWRAAVQAVGLDLLGVRRMIASDDEPQEWQRRSNEVDEAIADAHHNEPAWQQADDQSSLMGRLLGNDDVIGRVIHLVRS